ncbi:MAG: hypothetical protein A3D87_06460 [Omnitrophica WOR_2 bacterium RIFCSPHIGHO2_02_FULL_50_17]|nr:MAG: hypothetical protein A3D87_06460 [Omnitrophica WOR_2 bacterium RIFCSPHIGHO2_02_FULL_50_17]
MKIAAIGLGVILFVLSFGLAVHYNQNALNFRADLERERYARLVAEENGERVSGQIRQLETELAKIQKKMAGAQKSLDQSQLANADLQARLEEEAAIRESLEKKMKDLEGALADALKPKEAVTVTEAGAI